MTSLFLTKTVGCFVLFLINAVTTFTAFAYVRTRTNVVLRRLPRGLSYANSFSIGLFLSVCFLGLYNHSYKKILAIQHSLNVHNRLKFYPIAETTLCLGFFTIWFVECLVRMLNLAPSHRRSQLTTPCARKKNIYWSLSDASESNANEDDVDGDQVVLLSRCDTPLTSADTSGTGSAVEQASIGSSSNGSFLRSLFLCLAMGLHTFFEALGLSLLDSVTQVFTMAFAMALHQALCSSSLGLRLGRTTNGSSNYRYSIAMLLIYLLLLPLGVFIGFAVHTSTVHSHPTDTNQPCSNQTGACLPSGLHDGNAVFDNTDLTNHIVMATMQNFAAATLLYVIFVEMLPAEMSGGTSCMSHTPSGETASVSPKQCALRCVCAVFGFLLIASIQLIGHN